MVEVSLWLEFIRVVVVELLAAMDGIGRNNYRSVLGDEHSLIPVIFGNAMWYTQWKSMKWISFLDSPIQRMFVIQWMPTETFLHDAIDIRERLEILPYWHSVDFRYLVLQQV